MPFPSGTPDYGSTGTFSGSRSEKVAVRSSVMCLECERGGSAVGLRPGTPQQWGLDRCVTGAGQEYMALECFLAVFLQEPELIPFPQSDVDLSVAQALSCLLLCGNLLRPRISKAEPSAWHSLRSLRRFQEHSRICLLLCDARSEGGMLRLSS